MFKIHDETISSSLCVRVSPVLALLASRSLYAYPVSHRICALRIFFSRNFKHITMFVSLVFC